jgi:hypothetical protein
MLKRFPSPKSTNTPSTSVLQLLHTDMAGPVGADSYDEKRCILTLLDDYTKMSWIATLHNKEQVPTKLLQMCTMVETQSDAKIKAIRSDNGINNVVLNYCAQKGI